MNPAPLAVVLVWIRRPGRRIDFGARLDRVAGQRAPTLVLEIGSKFADVVVVYLPLEASACFAS